MKEMIGRVLALDLSLLCIIMFFDYIDAAPFTSKIFVYGCVASVMILNYIILRVENENG